MGLPSVKPLRSMTFLAFFGHLTNLLAPALVVAVLLAGVPGRRRRTGDGRHGFWRHVAWSSLAGAAVLLAGLAWFGRDGKIATYAALVLVQGTMAWFLRGRGLR